MCLHVVPSGVFTPVSEVSAKIKTAQIAVNLTSTKGKEIKQHKITLDALSDNEHVCYYNILYIYSAN